MLTLRPALLLCRFVAARLLRRRELAAVHRASQNARENSIPNATLSAQPPHLKPSTLPSPPLLPPAVDGNGDRPQPHLETAPVLHVLATACKTAVEDRAKTNACSRLPGNKQRYSLKPLNDIALLNKSTGRHFVIRVLSATRRRMR